MAELGDDENQSPERASIAEIAVVLGLTVGLSLLRMLEAPQEVTSSAFTDEHLVGLVVFQLLVAAILVPWLSSRGWSPREIGGTPAGLLQVLAGR